MMNLCQSQRRAGESFAPAPGPRRPRGTTASGAASGPPLRSMQFVRKFEVAVLCAVALLLGLDVGLYHVQYAAWAAPPRADKHRLLRRAAEPAPQAAQSGPPAEAPARGETAFAALRAAVAACAFLHRRERRRCGAAAAGSRGARRRSRTLAAATRRPWTPSKTSETLYAAGQGVRGAASSSRVLSDDGPPGSRRCGVASMPPALGARRPQRRRSPRCQTSDHRLRRATSLKRATSLNDDRRPRHDAPSRRSRSSRPRGAPPRLWALQRRLSVPTPSS
jgi:hypothetical protein